MVNEAFHASVDLMYSPKQRELLRTLRIEGDWASQAKCIGNSQFTLDPEDMAGDKERKEEWQEYCKAVCEGCPVLLDCLHHALTFPEHHGFWGGRNKHELRVLRNKMGKR